MTCGSDGLAAACRIPASDAMARGGWGPGRLGKRPPLHVWRKEFPRRGDKTWDPVTGVSGQRQEPGVTLQAAHGDRPLLEGTGQAHKAQSPHGAVEGAGQAHVSVPVELWRARGRHTRLNPRGALEVAGQAQEAQRPHGAVDGTGQGAGQGSHSICLSAQVCSTDFHVSPLVLVQRCWGPTPLRSSARPLSGLFQIAG